MGCLLLRQVLKIWQPSIAAFCGAAESLSTLGVNSILHWKTSKPVNDFLCSSQASWRLSQERDALWSHRSGVLTRGLHLGEALCSHRSGASLT